MKSLVKMIGLGLLGLVAPVICAITFFVFAGRKELPIAWASLVVLAVLCVVATVLMDPGLLRERLKPGPGGRDKALIRIAAVLCAATVILAGLDVGRHWSPAVPSSAQVAACIGFALGLSVAIWSMIVNRFFSPLIRLQTDRGHHVITGGPYRFVRHPGYTGILLCTPCFPIALGSWIAVLPALALDAMILRRLVLEDRFLHDELEGYREYSEKVPYRLLPGLW